MFIYIFMFVDALYLTGQIWLQSLNYDAGTNILIHVPEPCSYGEPSGPSVWDFYLSIC